jgi:hypothetical protein
VAVLVRQRYRAALRDATTRCPNPIRGRLTLTWSPPARHTVPACGSTSHARWCHGLEIDASAATLAFGTTTGSLWVSEDQGDSWQCMSQHLPPVYCIRFAT